jgi:hypothetical protein
MILRIVSFVLAAIAFLFAGFQYNDPDPWIWIGLYGAAGISLSLAAIGMPVRGLAWATALASLVFAGIAVPGVWQYLTNHDGQTLANAMSKEHPYIEQTREFGGAIIVLIMALVAGWTAKPKLQTKNGEKQKEH